MLHVFAVRMERQRDVPVPGVSCLCHEEPSRRPEIWVRIVFCPLNFKNDNDCVVYEAVKDRMQVSVQQPWVIVSEPFTSLTLCLLSGGNSPGFRTSSCATTRPECPSGSWWRPRGTLQAWWKRKMWSRLSGRSTAPLKIGALILFICVLVTSCSWNRLMPAPWWPQQTVLSLIDPIVTKIHSSSLNLDFFS